LTDIHTSLPVFTKKPSQLLLHSLAPWTGQKKVQGPPKALTLLSRPLLSNSMTW